MSNSIVRGIKISAKPEKWENPRLYYIKRLQAKTPTRCPECETNLIIDDEEIYCPNCGLITETSIQYVAGIRFFLPHGLRLG